MTKQICLVYCRQTVSYIGRMNKAPGCCRLTLLLLAVATGIVSAGAQSPGTVRITNQIPSGWALSWSNSTPGTVFTVQYQDSMQDGIWRIPDSPVQFPVSGNQWLDVSSTNQSRFYRVAAVAAAQRGKVLASTLTSTMTTLQLAFVFSFAGVPVVPLYNVRLYRVDYETVTALGARTLASGALLLPEGAGSFLPLVSYQHGTITQTNQAPSSMDLNTEVTIGIALATTGYAAVVPDYLGLGDSPGFHPYHHARAEATVCVDMLRAAKAFCASNGFPLNNKLFLCGYSEGGHVTMSLLRELETYHTNEFTVTACAPMAGAYDLSGVTTTNFLSGRVQPNPYYFLYLLAAYEDIYHFAPSLADLLAPPYNTTLPPLLNGNSSGVQMNAAMPADPVQILKPQFLADFRANPRHPLRLALEENNVYRWVPRSPLRMYHCAGDQDVIIANSQVAYNTFRSLGASQVQLIDPQPGAGHGDCAQPSLLLAKEWFDSLR
jgi:pimeloyl-ACP methyl ester carboxylesterase